MPVGIYGLLPTGAVGMLPANLSHRLQPGVSNATYEVAGLPLGSGPGFYQESTARAGLCLVRKVLAARVKVLF